MQNYHRHSSYSNLFIADSSATNEDYAKRAVELGQKVICSVEHGWQGYYFQTFELAKKYNLKCVIGTEAYWVKDRQKEYETGIDKNGDPTYSKDKANNHIILLAKNNNGREQINDILSEANITGYYYRPRVDLELLLSLSPDDVFVTSACIAFNGYGYENSEQIIKTLHDHFKDNFMLEIQYHDTDLQKDWNQFLKKLSVKYGISLIVGLDSHYIYPEEKEQREIILEAKNVHYENEDDWYMDYPDEDTVMKRFLEQGVFTADEIQIAMDNTDICLTFDDYDDVPIFNKEIKLPTLYPGKTKEEKDKIYSKLITQKFKEAMKNLPPESYKERFEGVKMEVQTYKDTGMVDYPLLDYAIVKDAVEHGGIITDSGRGSASSYWTNSLLGFSSVDRFTSAIKLYPERFISTTRILETKSLPDIDLNVGTVEIFEDAQKRVLGEDHVAPMIAFGTLKKKSAFKLYAKAKNMDFALANEISNQITQYDEAVKFAEEDEKDLVDIYDYVDEQYRDYIEQSEEYWGIIADKKKAPSAYLLYQGNIRREIGLIKCKSESTKKEYITCVIDGAIAENYKFLKNDILKVDSVLLIDKVFNKIGIEHFDVNTLLENIKNDSQTWDIYSNGYTVGINQVEQSGSKHKCMNYKPKNISELSAFVAAIRPGFKSMYDRFEKREDFRWGINALDNLLRTEELPVSFLFFQEQVMSVLHYAGFPMEQCYGMIKAIAKKHPEKVKPLKEQFIKGFKEKLIIDEQLSDQESQDCANQVWTIVNDNCGYGFNCVSGSTKIIKGAKNNKFNPTVEEMYKMKNDYNYAKETGHLALRKKYRRYGYGQALSMYDDNKLRPNDIVDIYPAGIRQTYKVETESGCFIICTANHKFPTPNGKKRLDELKVGDELYCKGEYKHKNFDTSFTIGNFEKNIPKKGEQGFQKNPNGASVKYLSFRKIQIEHKNPCEACGKLYSNSERFEVHHKDFNRKNNNFDNFIWLCCSCHKTIHYNHGRKKRYDNGINTYISKIKLIEPYAIEMTYDIEMKDPAHTFVSESGLVTSNSSHAFCMALDSAYQAWQKAHYPYEFYEVNLQHFSDKGKKDKVSKLKAEMKTAFSINEGSYKFRTDNRTFSIDKEHGCIYPALASIKGLSNSMAEQLYKLKDKHFDTFFDLLDSLKISFDKLTTLIKLDYFSEFGDINKLLTMLQLYKDYNSVKLIKKDKNPFPEYLVLKYSTETEKQYKITNSRQLLIDYVDSLTFEKTTLINKIQYQQEYLGYIQITLPKLSPEYYFITDINGKWGTMYQLKTGNIVKMKFQKKPYTDITNRIIRIDEITQDKKWGKDSEGKWYRKDEMEDLVSAFEIIK